MNRPSVHSLPLVQNGKFRSRTALMIFSGAYDVTCKRQWSAELEGLSGEPNVIIDFSDVRLPRRYLGGVVRVVECLDDATEPQSPAPAVHHAFCGKARAARKRVGLA